MQNKGTYKREKVRGRKKARVCIAATIHSLVVDNEGDGVDERTYHNIHTRLPRIVFEYLVVDRAMGEDLHNKQNRNEYISHT
jgi:hypothetical protein